MEVMLSGRQLYGASCLPPGTGDLVNRLPPQGKPGSSPWAPLLPTRKGVQANGCCWRRGPVSSAEDGDRPLELAPEVVFLPAHRPSERAEEGGDVGSGSPVVLAGSTAQDEGCPSLGAPTVEEAEGGSCHGASTTVEVEDGSCHRAGPPAEVEGGSCHGAGPPADVEGLSCYGVDPHTEVEDGSCHGAGPPAELESGSCCGAGPPAEVEGWLHQGPGLGAVAENGCSHGAGSTMQADGTGQMVEKECGPCDGAGPRVEADDGPCHGAGAIAEAESGPYHGAGHTAEINYEPCHGAGQRGNLQDHGNYVGKGDIFTDLTKLQQRWCMEQDIQAGKESATEMTGLSETHPSTAWAHSSPTSAIDLCPTGLVTTVMAAMDGQARRHDATLEENKEPEESDDEFGAFEKAGNLVLWAEPPGTLWLEGEELLSQSGSTAVRDHEPGEDMADHRAWRPWPESAQETAQHRPSLHGSADRAVESRSPQHSPALTPRGEWRAFHSDSQSRFDAFPLTERETVQRGVGEQWWSAGTLRCSTSQTASPSEPSPGRGGLESMFRSSFPAVASACSSRDAFPTLGRILGGTQRGDEELVSGQACELWALLRDMDEAVGLKHKQTGCRSRRLLLESLRVDPADTDFPASCTTALGSSPQSSSETTLSSCPSPVALGRDSKELMLIKNSCPQHQMNGFSPSHRIQAFFYHWTQADRNGRSKTPYDVNKNFMA